MRLLPAFLLAALLAGCMPKLVPADPAALPAPEYRPNPIRLHPRDAEKRLAGALLKARGVKQAHVEAFEGGVTARMTLAHGKRRSWSYFHTSPEPRLRRAGVGLRTVELPPFSVPRGRPGPVYGYLSLEFDTHEEAAAKEAVDILCGLREADKRGR